MLEVGEREAEEGIGRWKGGTQGGNERSEGGRWMMAREADR